MTKNLESLHADCGVASDSGWAFLQNWTELGMIPRD